MIEAVTSAGGAMPQDAARSVERRAHDAGGDVGHVPPDATPLPENLHLARQVYPLRIAGFALGALPAAMVLRELGSPPWAWLLLALMTLAWPHVAYLLARRSDDPQQAERRNLLVDSAITAGLVPLMHFNLLPSALLLTLTSVDKISTGIRALWLRSVPWMVASLILMTLLTAGAFAPMTSMPVLLACLPALVIHTVAVSLASYRLIRRVNLQNQELDRLRRTDALTGLPGRSDWEERAAALLRDSASGPMDASLLLIDIDGFKQVNDRLGHAVGDDVLRALATPIRDALRAGDHAGRLGGDEFVVLLPGATAAAARGVAERIRCAVAALRLPEQPALRITASIGIAPLEEGSSSLRTWIGAADRALYRAKDAGRDRTAD